MLNKFFGTKNEQLALKDENLNDEIVLINESEIPDHPDFGALSEAIEGKRDELAKEVYDSKRKVRFSAGKMTQRIVTEVKTWGDNQTEKLRESQKLFRKAVAASSDVKWTETHNTLREDLIKTARNAAIEQETFQKSSTENETIWKSAKSRVRAIRIGLFGDENEDITFGQICLSLIVVVFFLAIVGGVENIMGVSYFQFLLGEEAGAFAGMAVAMVGAVSAIVFGYAISVILKNRTAQKRYITRYGTDTPKDDDNRELRVTLASGTIKFILLSSGALFLGVTSYLLVYRYFFSEKMLNHEQIQTAALIICGLNMLGVILEVFFGLGYEIGDIRKLFAFKKAEKKAAAQHKFFEQQSTEHDTTINDAYEHYQNTLAEYKDAFMRARRYAYYIAGSIKSFGINMEKGLLSEIKANASSCLTALQSVCAMEPGVNDETDISFLTSPQFTNEIRETLSGVSERIVTTINTVTDNQELQSFSVEDLDNPGGFKTREELMRFLQPELVLIEDGNNIRNIEPVRI